MLRALGVTGLVRSPTYTLVETYALAALTCVHVDLYRLQRLSEVDELGLRDFVDRAHCCWWNGRKRAASALPAADLMVRSSTRARRAGDLSGGDGARAQWLKNLGLTLA